MNEEIEVKAKQMGWAPREEWRGDPERWVDAELFVKRGEEILPIVRANNKRYLEEVEILRSQLAAKDTEFSEFRQSVEDLKKVNAELAKERASTKKLDLAARLKEAREQEDLDTELAIQEELAALRAPDPIKETPPTPPTTPPTMPPEVKAEFDAWKGDNPWFEKDYIRAANMNIIGAKLRQEGNTLTGRPFLDMVAQEVNKLLGPVGGEPFDRVSSGRPSGGDSASGIRGKSYADLPPEARAACDKDIPRLVGSNKMFKTEADWKKYYVSKYFEE